MNKQIINKTAPSLKGKILSILLMIAFLSLFIIFIINTALALFTEETEFNIWYPIIAVMSALLCYACTIWYDVEKVYEKRMQKN